MFDLNYPNYPTICSICRAKEKFKFIRDFYVKKNKYSLYQCPKCYVQFWWPKLKVGRDWYEKEGNPYHVRDLAGLKIRRVYHKLFLKRHKKLIKGK